MHRPPRNLAQRPAQWLAQARGAYYGWWVVAGVFLIMSTTAGFGFYNLSVFLRALTVERFDVRLVSGATSVFFLASGFASLAVGQLIERYDARYVIAISATAAAVLLAFIGEVTAVWQLYALYAVFGLFYSGCSLVPGTTIVARWFARRRAVALSIASTGLSVGGILVTPLSVWMIERLGLAAASHWLALLFFLGVVPPAIFLLRPSPQSMGLRIDGDPPRAEGEPEGPPDGVPWAEAVRSRFFVGLSIAYLFAMMAQVGAISHQFSLVSVRGDAALAALAVSTLAVSSIVGRLAGGIALSRLPIRLFTIGFMVMQGLGLVSLALADGVVLLIGASALFGITVGNILMLQPLLIGEAFGLRDYGRLFALSQMIGTLGVASGPFIVGFVYEASGGYGAAYGTIACGSLIAMTVFALAGPVHREPGP